MNKNGEGCFLSPYRVLDLSDENGFLCGRILGDMGADVIKIEGVGGDRARSIEPFYRDNPHPGKSLFWFAFNLNKRGITLNLETADGQEIFKKLAKTSDFIVESFAPAYLDELGLGYSVLRNLNPRIILISITPFGQTGPYRDFKGSDIVGMAMGGQMYLVGDTDRPPVRISFFQAALHACGQGAIGALVALLAREKIGHGQHVDVSIQQSVTWTTQGAHANWVLARSNVRRAGGTQMGLSVKRGLRVIWPCKDGFVTYRVMGGAFGAKTNYELVKWMEADGFDDNVLRELKRKDLDLLLLDEKTALQLESAIASFFMNHTKAELYNGGIKRRMTIYPVNTTKDVTEDPQLKARQFWTNVQHSELGCQITYPGAFIKASESPVWIRRRAPLIGEHNEEIYIGELGLSIDEVIALKQASVI